MAVIDFLPVCSHCHQVLWGETIGVEERDTWDIVGAMSIAFGIALVKTLL